MKPVKQAADIIWQSIFDENEENLRDDYEKKVVNYDLSMFTEKQRTEIYAKLINKIRKVTDHRGYSPPIAVGRIAKHAGIEIPYSDLVKAAVGNMSAAYIEDGTFEFLKDYDGLITEMGGEFVNDFYELEPWTFCSAQYGPSLLDIVAKSARELNKEEIGILQKLSGLIISQTTYPYDYKTILSVYGKCGNKPEDVEKLRELFKIWKSEEDEDSLQNILAAYNLPEEGRKYFRDVAEKLANSGYKGDEGAWPDLEKEVERFQIIGDKSRKKDLEKLSQRVKAFLNSNKNNVPREYKP